MTITTNRFTLEFFGLTSFFIRAFGYEVFKPLDGKLIISQEVTTTATRSL